MGSIGLYQDLFTHLCNFYVAQLGLALAFYQEFVVFSL
ncbi:hypothetical protein RintRC_1046 [Richelia intracellularis]|nr:hypothetical protein RintRC_1046 [Richelia intracellularis]